MDINLFHGWLVDPQNDQENSIIANRSYNELVEMIISSKSSDDNHQITQGIQIDSKKLFLFSLIIMINIVIHLQRGYNDKYLLPLLHTTLFSMWYQYL